MKERLIPYAPDMVRAKRAGLKTQTRRVLHGFFPQNRPEFDPETGRLEWLNGNGVVCGIRCPYGKPGDILLTREAWCASSAHDDLPPREIPVGDAIAYLADGEPPILTGRYRHARFMCRWMCRDRDKITAVRVERLQDISEADAIAEGVQPMPSPLAVNTWWQGYTEFNGELIHQQFQGDEPPDWMIEPKKMKPLTHLNRSAVDMYRALWEQIHGAGSWDANPWVWVVEFRRIES